MLNVSLLPMKTPPFLLFATLLFWGWQSGLPVYGAAAGVLLEAPRFVKFRWELEDVDFNRIWSLCLLLIVALGAYIFTVNDNGAVKDMFQGPVGLRIASASSAAATNTVFRLLPLLALPFMAAQAYNLRPTVPMTAISLVLRIRRRRGEEELAGRYYDISYAYFIVTLFAAGIHTNPRAHTYFAGLTVLILWALWTLRTGRYGWKAWVCGAMAVVLFGVLADLGMNRLERAFQNLSAEWFNRLARTRTDPFESVTAIGEIGELKLSSRIVIRLQPEQVGIEPNYLHEVSYRIYFPKSQTWRSGLPMRNVDSATGSSADFSRVTPEPDTTSWVLAPARTNGNKITIACYLEGRSQGADGGPQGVLPLPPGTSRLENLSSAYFTLETNLTGVVLASGPGLAIFDARYGPGAALDSPPSFGTNGNDLAVPTNDLPALQQVAAELGLTNASASDWDKRLAVQSFFASKFTYSTWQRPQTKNQSVSPLTRFLLDTRRGHCEYFATATVLLMRQLGVPARYSVGYAVHETSGTGYVVRERDAHAWCLVWNSETRTWDDFDTTPASWMAIEGRNASFLDDIGDLRSWLVFQFEKLRWRQAHLRQYIFWTFTPVMAVLLYYIIFQRRRKAGRASGKTVPETARLWPGHDSAFYRLEKSLAERGLPRPPPETLADWLERALQEPALAALRAPLRELLRLHYRYRFDPSGLSIAERKALTKNAEAALQRLEQMKGTSG
jgi:transglutaminase-like putative cysteine protease